MSQKHCTFALGTFVLLAASAPLALAGDPPPRIIEVTFAPQGIPAISGVKHCGKDYKREELSPQIAVWIEQPDGKFIADLYVTSAVGLHGLGNRPGQALLQSDFRWPYGRRPMALPIWAHRRGKQYGYVVMGGKCSTQYPPLPPPPPLDAMHDTCPVDFQMSPSDDDNTIAYHGPVSSTEPYYCSPSGWRTTQQGGVDVVTCASPFYGSKGWYAPGYTSPYPPRADLMLAGGNDHPDEQKFATDNDVAAISAATPPNGRMVDPIRWYTTAAIPDGDYVAWVEVNIEGDFNTFWQCGKAVPEPHSEWNYLGQDFLGQPSIVYKVPFRLEAQGRVATAVDYSGYGDWHGDNGNINPPDATISQDSGSGADRLKIISDENGSWRVKVGLCDVQTCETPAAPDSLDLSESTDATLTVKFTVPSGPAAAIYEVRYLLGMPITAENFNNATPALPTNLAPPGQQVSTRITGLAPKSQYYVAVRPKNCCGDVGAMIVGQGETAAAQFATLSGCFVATAAYGSEMAPEVELLRRFRDERLIKSPLGQAAVASYYALSPGLATLIGENEELRTLARSALWPIIHAAARSMSNQLTGFQSRPVGALGAKPQSPR